MGSYNFSGIDVWVPASSVQVYKSADYWRENNIHSIGDESSVNAPLNSPVEIHRTTYGIRLRNVAVGERIQVLATDGVQLQSLQAEEEAVDLLLEKEHVYIIIIGIKVFKISL